MALPPSKLTSVLQRGAPAPERMAEALAADGCLTRQAAAAQASVVSLVAATLAEWDARAARAGPGWTGPSPMDAVAEALASSDLLSARGRRWAKIPREREATMSSEKKKTGFWWPDVSTPAGARSATMYGVWAALFSAVVTAALAAWSIVSGEAAPDLVDAWSFVDVAIFAAIAFGIWKRSRFAAVAGLVIFVAERIYVMATTPGGSGLGLALVLAMCYVAAIRGTYAFRRLASVETGS
jgi:hypothetical protein